LLSERVVLTKQEKLLSQSDASIFSTCISVYVKVECIDELWEREISLKTYQTCSLYLSIKRMPIHDFDWLRKAACLSVSSGLPACSLQWDSWRSNLNIVTMLQIPEGQTARFIQKSAVEN
jgi:hypothetical protein